MNLIQKKIHGNDEHTHDGQPHTHQAPFWVRYYDTIVGVVTLGRARKMHQSTLQLANSSREKPFWISAAARGSYFCGGKGGGIGRNGRWPGR
ncbi:MAG: hypothetical protein H6656_02640 [Ardenticatenaceae bacterium]|nr:hypothetical protein [Ardenticatenaceae bacterium]